MKLTPWFDLSTPPVRVGVYMLCFPLDDATGETIGETVHYSVWTGFNWLFTAHTVADAARQCGVSPSVPRGVYSGWRGVAK